MSEYTNGPWESRESTTSNYLWEIVATSARGIKYVIARLAAPKQGNREANARLIAAAPDLLEALKSVLDSLGALTKRHELLNYMSEDEAAAVFAAIAKAEGK